MTTNTNTESKIPEFFEAGRVYRRRRWLFRCLAVASEPFRGELRAAGFLYRPGENVSTVGFDAEQWEHDGWTLIDAPCVDRTGNPFTSHDFTPDGLGDECRRCGAARPADVFLALYDGAPPELHSDARKAEAVLVDYAAADRGQGQGFDVLPEDEEGTSALVWTDADTDRPTGGSPGQVYRLTLPQD